MPRATPADRYDLARQAWEILVEVAEQPERGTITYGELAEELNARTGRNLTGQHMRGPLILITDYCDRHGLPRLNDLAVNKASGWPSYDPGSGYDFAIARAGPRLPLAHVYRQPRRLRSAATVTHMHEVAMADETTRGRREFRKGDRVLIAHSNEPCRFRGYISRSLVAVECPDGPHGQHIEVPRDQVWHADAEGCIEKTAYIVEKVAHKIEG